MYSTEDRHPTRQLHDDLDGEDVQADGGDAMEADQVAQWCDDQIGDPVENMHLSEVERDKYWHHVFLTLILQRSTAPRGLSSSLHDSGWLQVPPWT